MKIPIQTKRTCRACNTITVHKISTIKAGKPSPFAKIIRIKDKKPGIGNRGKFSKVPAKKKKQSRRPHLLQTCLTPGCGRKGNFQRPRTMRYEIK